MPSVAEELAALRKAGSVRHRATSLKDKGGAALSTPEAEEAALRAKKEREKLGNVEAKDILNKGSNAAALASAEEAAKVTARKREDRENKSKASQLLRKGGSAPSQELEHARSQSGAKKADWEKKTVTRKEMAGGVASPKGGSPEKSAAPQATEASKKEDGEAAGKVEDPKEAVSQAAEKAEPEPVQKKETTTSASAPVETDDDVPELEEAVDDGVPELESASDATQRTTDRPQGEDAEEEEEEEEGGERQVANRNEKKARKLMTRLGMRPVPHVARVSLKAAGGRGHFFIDKPDVFVGGRGDTYVIFGEARQGGGGVGTARAQAAAAQQRAAAAAAAAAPMPSVEAEEAASPEEPANATGEDEEGVEAKDVELVMGQASCTRARAVQALRENDGDLVNAIMSLTT